MKFPAILIFIISFFSSEAEVTKQKNLVLNDIIVVDTCQLPIFREKINLNANSVGVSDMKVTPDNGYLITGQYRLNSSPSTIRGYIMKLNQFGAIEWQKAILYNAGNSSIDFRIYPVSLMLTADGGYSLMLLCDAFTVSFGNMLVKFDKNGNIEWTKKYNFYIQDALVTACIATSDNGFAMTVTSASRFQLCKMDAQGNIDWVKNFPRNIDIPGSLMLAKGLTELNNSFFIAGKGSGISGNNSVQFLIKVNKNTGQVNWCKSYGGLASAGLLSLNRITTANNKLVVSGMFDTGQPDTKQGIFHFSEDGILEKAIKIKNISNTIFTDNLFHSPPVSENGAYAGHTLQYYNQTNNTISDTAAFIFKLDNNGLLEWKWRYTWPGEQSIVSIKNTDDGGFIAAGPKLGIPASSASIQIIKADTAGLTAGCTFENAGLTATIVFLDTASHSIPVTEYLVDAIVDTNMFTISTDFTRELLCSKNMECANLKITGQDSICEKNLSYLYKITKDTACHQPALWQVSDANIAQILSQTDSTVTIKYSRAGTVKIYAKFQLACSSISDSMSVHIFNNPDTLNLGPDLNLCINGFYELNAHSGYKSYLWQNGSTDSTFTVLAPGNYYVTVRDSCGNVYSDTVVAIAAPPEILNIGNDTVICKRDSIILNVTPGFISYIWTPNYNISNTTISNPWVFPLVNTVYKLKATKRPGCTLVDSILISVHPTPDIRLGNDTSICSGTFIMLDAGSGFQNYLWNTGATSQQITVSQKNIYSVLATDNNGCRSADSLEIINILANPIVKLSKDSFICDGSTLKLDAGQNYVSYSWQDGSTNPTYLVNNMGSFWVRVIDNRGCIGFSDTTTILSIEPKPANFIIRDTSICKFQTLHLIALSEFKDYLWSTGETTNSVTLATDGVYWLNVINFKGCQAKEFVTVKPKECLSVIYFPNSFTPNNDGLNDIFRPTIYGTIESFQLYLYNRYGQLIFYSSNWLQGWDGKYNTKLQDMGAYTWVARYKFKGKKVETVTGSVMIIK